MKKEEFKLKSPKVDIEYDDEKYIMTWHIYAHLKILTVTDESGEKYPLIVESDKISMCNLEITYILPDDVKKFDSSTRYEIAKGISYAIAKSNIYYFAWCSHIFGYDTIAINSEFNKYKIKWGKDGIELEEIEDE